ncbi:transcription-repair coupling factor [Candidatus Peregrinibacteria bacterium]|nr:transcription-repair coupling factor [Candidatus Peregrinibacteria bacterium]
MQELISVFSGVQNNSVLEAFQKFQQTSISGAGNFASKAFILADILRNSGQKPILWIVNDTEERETVAQCCAAWFPKRTEILKLEISKDNKNERKMQLLYCLKSFLEKDNKIIIAPYTELMTHVPDVEIFKKETIKIHVGEKASTVELFEKLIAKNYEVSPDDYLARGTYLGKGDTLNIFPVNSDFPIRIEFEYGEISAIYQYSQDTGDIKKQLKTFSVYPLNVEFSSQAFFRYVPDNALLIEDELEVTDEHYEAWDGIFAQKTKEAKIITFTSFPEDSPNHQNLRYMSVLKYQNMIDLAMDIKEKSLTGWRMCFFTKHAADIKALISERNVRFEEGFKAFDNDEKYGVRIIAADKEELLPHSFQSSSHKILIVSDREIANLHEEKQKKISQRVFWEFLTSLKPNDLVVHINHGIARFEGLDRRMIDGITREYLKLGYAENDKLFVPIDQADKINKFIGAEEEAPKLTRLGSAEWATITKRVRKETEKIARELLELYAKRKQARGLPFKADTQEQIAFEKTFPYEETPGQIKAIADTKHDMEKAEPMDRLICGDVGFGKTEIAMRAAFKAVADKKQVAFISPITILADQHYKSFKKRMDDFHIRVEMLSRFKSHGEQKEILERLAKGEVDIVIGTHRLLQKDIRFKDLGLVIVDEEQRFGVKQKEQFKKMRTEVDILTLTATPIPRTLNICLNRLRDISTITTPPPGRLPIITEVRKYSHELIREAILKEIKRGGQIYFLHNRVQTINSITERLQALVPEARFGVAHGKLLSRELEERIMSFKDHKFDVLVSSTIIENGIDLPNANTLIVNNAEKFGLAQLYQLRGRVGRSKTQAYAYFLYHAQRLRLDAKKRLRAIVEASELGSGFQIAMKDLEIRGAGDILGVNQHGVINVVGVSHFIRMLNKTVEDLQTGKIIEEVEQEPEVSIELPLAAYVPDDYITNSKDKINIYQRMAAADSPEYLEELKNDVIEDFGKLPKEVVNLFRVIELKMFAKKAGLLVVKAENIHMKVGKQIILFMSKNVKPGNIVYMLSHNPKWVVSGTKLRIRIENLGLNWFDELRECVKMLGENIDREKIACLPDRQAAANQAPGSAV